MPFTQAIPKDARRNKDAGVVIALVYSGAGENEFKEEITLPAGSVLDAVTLRKEAIRRVSNQNASQAFEVFVKSIIDQPIDLTEPEDTDETKTLRAFAVLAGRVRDLERSQARGCASQDDYFAALAALQAAYEAEKDPAVRAKMDTVVP